MIVISAAIAALYFGREILIPLALSILLTFALAPLAKRLQRIGLPRVPAVLGAVLLAFVALGAFGVIVGNQLLHLAENLPAYQANVLNKLSGLQALAPSGGFLERGSDMLDAFKAQLPSLGSGGAPASEIPTVRMERPVATPFEMLWTVAIPLLAPVGTAGIVIVFVVFMLLEREDLRDRLIKLFGGSDLQYSTEAMNDAATRVSRFLLMQLLVNATYGIPIGVGLWVIGVPNALLWGLLATVLRFVPYVGPFIAAMFPILLSVAVDPGWSMLFWTLALIATVELISNCIVEPRLYGASTGISTVAILLAAIFWTALWGPLGLLLSTPLTVCIAVIGRYVPHLRFLDVMLGSEPVLSRPERLYQRMLSGDIDEGQDLAETLLRQSALTTFFDETALPALRLAEADRAQKKLPADLQATVSDSFCSVVREIADLDASIVPNEAPSTAPVIWGERAVLCIAGRTGLDLAASCMLAQLLNRRSIGARVLPSDAIGPDGISSLDLTGIELVVVSFLSASGQTHARQACRRLRRKQGRAQIMIGLWSERIDMEGVRDPAASLGADFVEVTTSNAFRTIEALATQSITCEMQAAPIPDHEDVRLAALHDLEVLDTPNEERFDRFTRRLAQVFDAPISLVSLIDADRQFWKSSEGLAVDDEESREAPRDTSICGHVVAENEVLVIEDVLKDKRFANNPWLKERGIRFYAGAPLRTDDGDMAIGSVCVIDMEPRKVSGREVGFLQFVADEVMREIRKGREEAKPPHEKPEIPQLDGARGAIQVR
ncbi:AI-2E family transporter [Limimaricola soesokkakensis]|uniref:AI-2E family transporter n=1 Tax=Limimaricola soesokkakensis TaxID=1343159 RepID=UPI003518ED5D